MSKSDQRRLGHQVGAQMKPINEMTDQELAEFVAAEFLGIRKEEHAVLDSNEYEYTIMAWEVNGRISRSADALIMSAQGREALEDECERKGWGIETSSPPGWENTKAAVIIRKGIGRAFEESSGYGPISTCKFYYRIHPNRYRAICEAVVMAVRGER